VTKCAVVLMSGGLDSTTCLGIALERGFEVLPVSFAYGQRHEVELQAVRRILDHYGIREHRLIETGFLRDIGGSALTSDDLEVPQHDSVEDLGGGIPVTYVPARNLIFLSCALAVAEVRGARDIFLGINAVDYSGYPDCRPEFLEQFQATANLATKAGVEDGGPFTIHAPLLHLSKADIVRRGVELDVPYALTHSCYSPTDEGLSCGQCDSCLLRLAGFREVGMDDPVPYATGVQGA
jgi:7-cyano-7-deazaguanine synthase